MGGPLVKMTTVFKLSGALATSALIADATYNQLQPDSDLFSLLPEPWDAMLRISAIALATIGTAATVFEVCYPKMRLARRRAGTLIAATTSAI